MCEVSFWSGGFGLKSGVVGTENTPKYTQKYREAGLKEWLQRVYGSCHPTQFTPPNSPLSFAKISSDSVALSLRRDRNSFARSSLIRALLFPHSLPPLLNLQGSRLER